jgi:peptidoglycan/LPS O-acetylase OafA/YrhL
MKSHSPSKPIQRFDTVDLLRGLSVLGVVYLHITILLPQYIPLQTYPVWLGRQYGDFGGLGVPCFFSISGFLITLTSIRRFGSLDALVPSAFYRIRFARIAPPLLLLLCILSALHWANVAPFHIDPSVSTLPRALFAVFTFRFNHLESFHHWFPISWIPLWTLSVEEMFYLCFPLVCALLLRRRWGFRVFLIVLIVLVVMGPTTRLLWYTPENPWVLHTYLGNMDNIALGCLFGLIVGHMGSRFSSNSTLLLCSIQALGIQALGVALIFFACGPPFGKHAHIFYLQGLMWKLWISPDILGLGTCLVMLGSVLRPSRGLLFMAPIRWVGRYSYEIYLNHEFAVIGVLLLYAKARKGPISLWAIGAILLSGLLGYLVSRYFSEPMNRLLRGAPLPSQLKSP